MRTAPLRRGLLVVLCLGLCGDAWAESSLRLDWPSVLGVVPASTYDLERTKVGAARLAMERLEEFWFHNVKKKIPPRPTAPSDNKAIKRLYPKTDGAVVDLDMYALGLIRQLRKDDHT